MQRSASLHRSTWGRAGIAGVLVGFAVAALVGTAGAVVPAQRAAAADDSLTSSAVTLNNHDHALNPDDAPFPDLEVTVSQTRDLVSQGIRIDWTGTARSTPPSGNVGGTNFLQIAQCWGEDEDNPGHPDRRTCQYGGTLGWGAQRDGTPSAVIHEKDRIYTDAGESYTGIPFIAFNPDRVIDEALAPADLVINNITANANGQRIIVPDEDFQDLNTNRFFTRFTTNEVRWASAGTDGSGSVPFEVQTAMQSPGLGCGAPKIAADGTVTGESCWLVIIPRGTGDSGVPLINRSGLWWDAWEHHLAVKLEFKPLGVRCELGKAERQLAGSELIANAISSWQPRLCAGEEGAPFVLSAGNEADALVRAAGTRPSPLAFTSQPLDLDRTGDETDPVAYAPVALSGLAIAFSIDRQPHPQNATAEQKLRAALPLTEMRLTPRLVAKLLTASYIDSIPAGSKAHLGYTSIREPGPNPRSMLQDPEFLAINDEEWAAQNIVAVSVADMLTPSGRSDLAVRVWEYVMADEATRAWLDGEPDEWGMRVNPWYSTNAEVVAEVNPDGAPFTLPTESFPKADPIEKPDTTVTDPANGTGPVNLVTWRPYTHGFADSAYNVLRGDGLLLGDWDKFSIPPKYGKSVRDLYGSQKVIGLTTAPAAELYQTVTASLLNPAGQFVAPTRDGIAAAAAAMTPTAAQSKVLAYDFGGSAAAAAPNAYPLSLPVYAALNPEQEDETLRATYASLIRYAVGDGQTPGTDVGELPPGYAPLPQSWVDQALAAAELIEHGPAAPEQPAQPTTPPSTSPAPSGGGLPSTSAPVVAPPTITGPDVTGEPVGALAGPTTPADPEPGPMAAAVPSGLAAGLGAALAVPLLDRIRRRR